MWGGTRQTRPTRVSPEFSDARADVIRTGVLISRGPRCRESKPRHPHESNCIARYFPPPEGRWTRPPPLGQPRHLVAALHHPPAGRHRGARPCEPQDDRLGKRPSPPRQDPLQVCTAVLNSYPTPDFFQSAPHSCPTPDGKNDLRNRLTHQPAQLHEHKTCPCHTLRRILPPQLLLAGQ